MNNLELHLPEQIAVKLEEAAERLGVSIEEAFIISLQEKLTQLDAEFCSASDYVLKKNMDLYRRLS